MKNCLIRDAILQSVTMETNLCLRLKRRSRRAQTTLAASMLSTKTKEWIYVFVYRYRLNCIMETNQSRVIAMPFPWIQADLSMLFP
jgi:hypothetical protein